jgi:hypothetical protein
MMEWEIFRGSRAFYCGGRGPAVACRQAGLRERGDEMPGRGWAEINNNEMNGWIFIHLGDDSGFKAKKK